MIETRVHSLTFGDLVWIEEGANPPDSSGVVYRVRAQDATFGTAVPLTTALLWLSRAGAPVSWDSTPNRAPVFRITVEANDSDLLARGEMALQLQCEQPSELVWTPPDGAGEPSVFEIVWSHLEPVFDRDGLTGVGMEEVVLRSRTYLVRMQALPYARSADLVVTPAQAPTPTYTPVDNGSSLTGWSVFFPSGGALSIVSGRVRVTNGGSLSPRMLVFRTASLDLSAAKYVAVDAASSVALSRVSLSGFALATTVDLGSGLFRYFFTVPAGTAIVSSLSLTVDGMFGTGAYFEVDQIQLSDAIPFIGTARQKAMSLVPGGSVRTQGSILVAHATAALGKVIVYTHRSGTGYLPPLRPWRVSGGTVTPDSTLVSGAREPIGPGGVKWRIPAPVVPQSRAELWVRLRATTLTGVKQIGWSVSSWMNGSALSYEVNTYDYNFAATNTWYLFPLGVVDLPPVQIGPSGYIEIAIQEGVVTHGIQVDEAYIFATDEGRLTVIDCDTGTPAAGGPSNRLWVDAPSPAQPTGAIFRGTAADRSDAFHAGFVSDAWGVHDLDPLGVSIFVVTPGSDGTTGASTSAEHYRRFNTFVARDS